MNKFIFTFLFLATPAFAQTSTSNLIYSYTEEYHFKPQVISNQYGKIVDTIQCTSYVGQTRIADLGADAVCVEDTKKRIASYLKSRPQSYLVLEIMHAQGKDQGGKPIPCWNYPGEDDGIIATYANNQLFVRLNCDPSVWHAGEKVQKRLNAIFEN